MQISFDPASGDDEDAASVSVTLGADTHVYAPGLVSAMPCFISAFCDSRRRHTRLRTRFS
jgi:hypothetical protein